MDNSYWLESLAAGKRGEALVKNALASYYLWVEDVADLYEYQQKDIDIIVDGSTIEIKNDLKSNKTNNVFIELTNANNKKRGGKGWYHYCEADYMAFVQENKGLIHFVRRDELFKMAKNYPVKFSFDSSGYCVPIAALRQCFSYKCMECEKL